MSPEDQRVWEEDAETEYAEAHAQAGAKEWDEDFRVYRTAERDLRAVLADAPAEQRAEGGE